MMARKKRAKLEEVGPESIVNETLQKLRDSHSVISKPAHRRLKEVSDRIVRVQGQIADVVEQLQAPEQALNSRGELIIQCDRLVSLGSKLRSEARAETRVIIAINRTLADVPKKLGLIYDEGEVGVHDRTKEAMIEAIENAPTPEARKELIRALELFKRAIA